MRLRTRGKTKSPEEYERLNADRRLKEAVAKEKRADVLLTAWKFALGQHVTDILGQGFGPVIERTEHEGGERTYVLTCAGRKVGRAERDLVAHVREIGEDG